MKGSTCFIFFLTSLFVGSESKTALNDVKTCEELFSHNTKSISEFSYKMSVLVKPLFQNFSNNVQYYSSSNTSQFHNEILSMENPMLREKLFDVLDQTIITDIRIRLIDVFNFDSDWHYFKGPVEEMALERVFALVSKTEMCCATQKVVMVGLSRLSLYLGVERVEYSSMEDVERIVQVRKVAVRKHKQEMKERKRHMRQMEDAFDCFQQCAQRKQYREYFYQWLDENLSSLYDVMDPHIGFLYNLVGPHLRHLYNLIDPHVRVLLRILHQIVDRFKTELWYAWMQHQVEMEIIGFILVIFVVGVILGNALLFLS